MLVKKNESNREFYVPFGDSKILIQNGRQAYFSPRAVLRIGMLLRDSEVAKEVRTQNTAPRTFLLTKVDTFAHPKK